VAEISAALPANPAEALLLTPVAPAPLPTAAIASDPAPQNRTATSGARNAGRSRENEIPRPRTDRIRPVAIHVRDSDQLLSLVESGAGERTALRSAPADARASRHESPATPAGNEHATPRAYAPEAIAERALPPAPLRMRTSAAPE
jgi:hypothetical protein